MTAVAEAELREVRKHSRSILVEAFVSGQATDKVMTEAGALAQLRLHTEQLAHAEELVEALRDAVAELENGFAEHDRRVAQAAGALVSRMPEFLALGERVYCAYAELWNCRLVVNEIGRLLTRDDRLLHLIECDQESDGRMTMGYVYNEGLVADWTAAITGVPSNADAPLPSSDTNGGTNSNPGNPPSPARGGRPSPPQLRA